MNEIKRKGFVLYMNKLQTVLPVLNNEEAGELLKAMFYYNLKGILPDCMSKTIQITISSFLIDFDRDFERYKSKVFSLTSSKTQTTQWGKMTVEDKVNSIKNELHVQVPMLRETDFLKYELSVITDWLSGKYAPKNWLFLTGNCGTGKTVLAKSICMAYNKANYSTIRFNGPNMNWIIKTSIDISNAMINSSNTYSTIEKANKLFIDDIGTEPKDQYVYGTKRNAIIELLLYRYDNNLPTILTSNLLINDKNGKNQILQRYGMRILDRIMEKSVVIEFNENSFRYLQNK